MGRLGARRGRYWREGSFLMVCAPVRRAFLRARARGTVGGKAKLAQDPPRPAEGVGETSSGAPPPSRVVVGEKGSLLARRVVFNGLSPVEARDSARTRKG